MREIICLNIGQAGVQLSNACWELFCIEHGVEANGLLKDSMQDEDSESFRTFFQEVPTGQFVPRTVSIDLEPTVIDEIRAGPYRKLFHPDQLLSSMEDGASNFARGCFTIGKQEIENLSNTLRKLVDCCEMLQGFFVLHSATGGTGSGFTTLILDTLTLEYTKRNKFQITVFPSPILSTAVVEPYNCVLGTVRSLEKSDVSNIMDNEAIYGICTSSLDVPRPSFINLNRIISQVFSDMTVSLRFDSSLNSDLDQMCTNLIPYPRIHFPVTCHAPLISTQKAGHEPLLTAQLTKSLFQKNSQMVSCQLHEGRYMCCVIQYRGNITPKDVNQAIVELKRKNEIKFVDWCPTGFKLGVSSQPPASVSGSDIAQSNKSATLLANSTCIISIWEKLMAKFDLLYSKKSFIHWYLGEGMEEEEFDEARDNIAMIYQDYAELGVEDEPADVMEPEKPAVKKSQVSENQNVPVEAEEIVEKPPMDMVMSEEKADDIENKESVVKADEDEEDEEDEETDN